MDSITLLGSERVQQAGYSIQTAAETIARAVNQYEETTFRLLQRLDELVERFEIAANKIAEEKQHGR